jgi:hypothetical protein
MVKINFKKKYIWMKKLKNKSLKKRP